MRRMFAILLALMLFSVVPQFTGANDDTGWSLPVNSLEARLSFGGLHRQGPNQVHAFKREN
jgi:hypothetical protein